MLFQDMKGAVPRYRRCCFKIWEVLIWLVKRGNLQLLSKINNNNNNNNK